jgi:2'-5' RNA ligase
VRGFITALLERKAATPATAWWGLPIDGPHLKVFQSAREEVVGMLGSMDDPGAPHVTVLFMGSGIKLGRVPGIIEKATSIVDSTVLSLKPKSVGYFNPTDNSGGRTPILVKYDSKGLTRLHQRLLRALASDITQDQFPTFRAHSTLGYFPGELSLEQKRQLKGVTLNTANWVPTTLLFSQGGNIAKRFSLNGG